MEENIAENFPKEEGLEVKDSQTFSIKETKEIKIHGVPEDMFLRYRDYARKYAKGNWTRALQMLLDAGEVMPLINNVVEHNAMQYSSLEERIMKIEESMNNKEESIKKNQLKTFGGVKE